MKFYSFELKHKRIINSTLRLIPNRATFQSTTDLIFNKFKKILIKYSIFENCLSSKYIIDIKKKTSNIGEYSFLFSQ